MGTSRTPKREFMYLDKVAQEKILKMIYDKQEEILSQGSDI
jgi:phage gpG-like protein